MEEREEPSYPPTTTTPGRCSAVQCIITLKLLAASRTRLGASFSQGSELKGSIFVSGNGDDFGAVDIFDAGLTVVFKQERTRGGVAGGSGGAGVGAPGGAGGAGGVGAGGAVAAADAATAASQESPEEEGGEASHLESRLYSFRRISRCSLHQDCDTVSSPSSS